HGGVEPAHARRHLTHDVIQSFVDPFFVDSIPHGARTEAHRREPTPGPGRPSEPGRPNRAAREVNHVYCTLRTFTSTAIIQYMQSEEAPDGLRERKKRARRL